MRPARAYRVSPVTVRYTTVVQGDILVVSSLGTLMQPAEVFFFYFGTITKFSAHAQRDS